MGPLSTSLKGVELFMETVLAAKPWIIDPTLVTMPWRKSEKLTNHLYGKRLKIAVMWSDNMVTPHPSVTRALTTMSSRLKNIGDVDVVDWKPYEHGMAWEIIVRSTPVGSTHDSLLTTRKAGLYYVDGGKETADLIDRSGEPWRPLSKFIIKENPYVWDRSLADVQELVQKRDNYRAEYASSEYLLWLQFIRSDVAYVMTNFQTRSQSGTLQLPATLAMES